MEMKKHRLFSREMLVDQVLKLLAKKNHVCWVSGCPMFFGGGRWERSFISETCEQGFCWEMYEYLEIVEWHVYPIEI